jgi:hypothetical protein
MAKIDLKFLDVDYKEITIETYLQANSKDTIIVYIADKFGDNHASIELDKSTAIKFAKTLRTEINKIES